MLAPKYEFLKIDLTEKIRSKYYSKRASKYYKRKLVKHLNLTPSPLNWQL